MGDLVATNVSVAVSKKGIIPGFARVARATITFGNGALTYPAAGIPMPTDKKVFGMSQGLIHYIPPVVKGGLTYEYEPSTHKLRIWRSAGFTPAGTVAAPVFTGTPISPGTPAGTVDAGTHVFTGGAMANITPAGANGAPAFAGAVVAAAALAEFSGAVPATSLEVMVFGN